MVSVTCTVDTGHDDVIHDAEMDYYGLQLATCSSDQTIKIFSVANGTQTLMATLKGHYGPVWQVTWANPRFGCILASCSYDHKVIVWKKVRDWEKFYEYSNHDASVNSVDFAPHEFGLMLACGSSDGSISVLSMSNEGIWESKKLLNAHAIGVNAVSWCPSGAGKAALSGGRPVKQFVSGGCDSLVKIWQEDRGRWVEKAKLDLHSDWVRDVAWSPSPGVLRNTIASCGQDRKVVIWTSEDNNVWVPTILHIFDDVVWNVSWSLSGGVLSVSGADNKVSLWKENPEGQWTCVTDGYKNQTGLTQQAREQTHTGEQRVL